MSEEVKVAYGDDASETATLLLAAAEELDLDQAVVRTAEGAFLVPAEVADQAGLEGESDDDESDEEPEKKTAAKKTATKKK